METQNHHSTEETLIKYKAGIGAFNEKMPQFIKGFNEFSELCFSEGALSQKEKQLIALGISVHAKDEYCIIYHSKGCLDQGCTEEEILEAVGVSAALGGGASLAQGVTLVQECITEFKGLTQ